MDPISAILLGWWLFGCGSSCSDDCDDREPVAPPEPKRKPVTYGGLTECGTESAFYKP